MKYEEAKALLRDCKCEYIRRAAWKAIDTDVALYWVTDLDGREYVAVAGNCPLLDLRAGPWPPKPGDMEADDWEAVP